MEAVKLFLQRLFLRLLSKNKNPLKAEPLLPVDYMVAVTKLATDREDRRFLNGNEKEASLVSWLMVRNARAEDEVLIYSKALSLPFYSEILRATCLSVSKPVFRIIIDDKQGVDIIKNLPEDVQSRINCRLATTKDGLHLLLTPVAFRAERKGFINELFVVCNFYEPGTVEVLKTRFERIWRNSIPCPIT